MEQCDDCKQEYEGPAYYTFDIEACQVTDQYEAIIGEAVTGIYDGGLMKPHAAECTGNVCPECAGDFLEPDDPDDPRRP